MKPIINCFLRYLKQTGVIPANELAVPPNPHADLVEAYCVLFARCRLSIIGASEKSTDLAVDL